MLCLRHYFQVRGTIIPFVTIYVMNYFPFLKWSAKHFFSNYAMLMPLAYFSV